MKTISILLLCFFTHFIVRGQNTSDASFIGGESMLDVYLKKHLSKAFEDVEMVFELCINREGLAHTPTLISPNNQDLQLALEKLVTKMPIWTPAMNENNAVDSKIKVSCWLEGPVVQDIDHSARFEEGEAEFYKFLRENLQNPIIGNKASVTVKFVVDKNGKIRHPVIWKGYSDDYNIEALRIVHLMPKMIPAQKNGMNVNSNYSITFRFR
jgi:hypothetical protein